VANSETPAVQNAQWKECGTIIVNDPAQVTAAACLTMRELVQGIQHECTGSMSGGGEPGCKDETRSAEKEAAKPRFGGSASSKGPRWRDGSIEKPVGTRTNAGGWSEAYYTVEQQRRLGVDETGKPIQEEGEAEDHSEEGEAKADSEVTRRYPGIARAIQVDGSGNACQDGVYYLMAAMKPDGSWPMWKKRDQCNGHTWMVRLTGMHTRDDEIDWSSFGEARIYNMVFESVEPNEVQLNDGDQSRVWYPTIKRALASRWKQ